MKGSQDSYKLFKVLMQYDLLVEEQSPTEIYKRSIGNMARVERKLHMAIDVVGCLWARARPPHDSRSRSGGTSFSFYYFRAWWHPGALNFCDDCTAKKNPNTNLSSEVWLPERVPVERSTRLTWLLWILRIMKHYQQTM